jgi:ribonuclease HI
VIVAYSDASIDTKTDILSVGYVLYESECTHETFIDTGCRVINLSQYDERDIEWTTQKAECYGGIIATRAALDYGSSAFILNMDANEVVRQLKQRTWHGESYFPHALFSFINRFDDYHISAVHRDSNEAAHEQARTGLKIGRDLQEGVL